MVKLQFAIRQTSKVSGELPFTTETGTMNHSVIAARARPRSRAEIIGFKQRTSTPGLGGYQLLVVRRNVVSVKLLRRRLLFRVTAVSQRVNTELREPDLQPLREFTQLRVHHSA